MPTVLCLLHSNNLVVSASSLIFSVPQMLEPTLSLPWPKSYREGTKVFKCLLLVAF